MSNKTYEFGEFQLDLSQKHLRKNGEVVPIQPKVFDVLAAFVERNNELITHDELMDEVWGDTFVEETNLRFCIHSLRKILGEHFVETIPTRGYRFNGEVREIEIEPQKTDEFQLPNSEENLISITKPFNQKFLIFASILGLIIILFVGFTWQNWRKPNDKMTISVLPFTQISEKSENNLRVTDATIAQLTKLKDFNILPVSSVQKYATQDFDALKVGSELNADAVLQGSFRQENGNVHVTANLLKTTNGETIWSDNFDVKADKDFDLETSIAARLARLFSLKSVEYEDEKLAKTQNINAEALNAYLSARKIWHSRDLGRGKEMTSLLQKAIELEPNWALAHSAKAEASIMDDNGVTVYENGEKEANQALAVDKKQAGALTVLGQVANIRDWKFAEAENYFKPAIEINPTYASAYNEYGNLLAQNKKFTESEKMLKQALKIEPFSPLYNTNLCQTYYYDKKADAALQQCRYAMQLEPNFWLARKQLFWTYAYRKMNKELAEIVLGNLSEAEKSKLPYAKSLAENNPADFWEFTLQERLNLAQKSNISDNLMIAMFSMQLDDKEKAYESLEKALRNKETDFPKTYIDPAFEPLFGESRYIEIGNKLYQK